MRILSILLLVLPLAFPEACAEGVRHGLTLAGSAAIPALFPFFVAGGLLSEAGTAAPAWAAKLLRRLYGPAAREPAGGLSRPYGRLSGRGGGFGFALPRGAALTGGRTQMRPVLLVRKSRLLRGACRGNALRLGAGRTAALRHSGRVRPAFRSFRFP